MRKLILGLAVSLDGFIEGPNGEYDWCFTDQDYGMTEFLAGIDSVFYGRKSWEMMIAAGQSVDDSLWREKKHYVFSNTLAQSGPGYQLVSGDVISAVKQIKQSPGKDVWLFGGASLTSTLLKAGLVDEIGIAVHPILLGKGKPLFSNLEGRIKLRLTDSKTYSTGLVYLTYHVEN
jgi:dihydrofolate reductase